MPASDQGKLSDRYTLVPRTLIFLTCGERILLMKGAPHKKLWANRYNGIGGHIERGEDVLSAAKRELFEETGLSAPDLHLCGVITIDARVDKGIGLFVFSGKCPEGETKPSYEGSLEWVLVQNIDKLPLVEDLTKLLPHILAMHPGDPPFSAHYCYNDEGQLQIDFGGRKHG